MAHQEQQSQPIDGYCISITTVCDGEVPIVRDGEGRIVVFATEREAQREIVDHQITRLQEFLDGDRDFEDAMTVEEYVVRCADARHDLGALLGAEDVHGLEKLKY